MKHKSITENTRRMINGTSTVTVNITALNPFFYNNVITTFMQISNNRNTNNTFYEDKLQNKQFN